MNIEGLENDYYLSGNDIWLRITDTPSPFLELTVKNINTGKSLDAFRMYPDPGGAYSFNVCAVIRSLQPTPNPDILNTLQQYSFKFESGAEVVEFQKYFIRGARDKSRNKPWHLNDGDSLIVGRWLNWPGVNFLTFAKRISAGDLVDFYPDNPLLEIIRGCDYKIVRFLNSLGAYQYFVFESYEYRNKPRAGKPISRTAYRLAEDNFRNSSSEDDRSLVLYARNFYEAQAVFEDLTRSIDTYLFHSSGTDAEGRWERLQMESNESVRNSFDRVYENKATFSLSTYQTREI